MHRRYTSQEKELLARLRTMLEIPPKVVRPRRKRARHKRPFGQFRWACKRARKAYLHALACGLTRAQAVSAAAAEGGLL